jgi:hypothetical protein
MYDRVSRLGRIFLDYSGRMLNRQRMGLLREVRTTTLNSGNANKTPDWPSQKKPSVGSQSANQRKKETLASCRLHREKENHIGLNLIGLTGAGAYLYCDGREKGVAVSDCVPGKETGCARVHNRPIPTIVNRKGVLAWPPNGDVSAERGIHVSSNRLLKGKIRRRSCQANAASKC